MTVRTQFFVAGVSVVLLMCSLISPAVARSLSIESASASHYDEDADAQPDWTEIQASGAFVLDQVDANRDTAPDPTASASLYFLVDGNLDATMGSSIAEPTWSGSHRLVPHAAGSHSLYVRIPVLDLNGGHTYVQGEANGPWYVNCDQ
jgi:hypothetical protein